MINRALRLLVALCLIGCGEPVSPRFSGYSIVTGQRSLATSSYIVTLDGDAKAFTKANGIAPRFTYSHALRGFAAELNPAAVDGLRHNPHVLSIEADQWARIADVQASPGWNLDRIDQRALPVDHSYGYSVAGDGVTIFIIDTGIRSTHVDLLGRVVSGDDEIGGGTEDCNGHGTGVAATAAGTIYGVAKRSTLVSVRIADCTGSSAISTLIAGVDWVTGNHAGPSVANVSFASGFSVALNAAVEASIASGVVYAVAAANFAVNACNYSPASASSAITVAASTRDITSAFDTQASYSNVGPCVDLYAPGSAIRSATALNDTATGVWSGTSFAAPMVAGVAALYLSANPSAAPYSVVAAILADATAGAITNASPETPNLLLHSMFSVAVPPVDTTPTPPPPVATTLTVTPSAASLLIGATVQLSATVRDQHGAIMSSGSVSWLSGNPSVASVNASGLVTAIASGGVGIVAQSGGASGSADITVTAPPPPPPPVDQLPVASFTQSCPKEKCTFDASSSTDDHGIISYVWSFGDGSTGSGVRPVHQYAAKQNYAITLTVTDTVGHVSTISKVVKA